MNFLQNVYFPDEKEYTVEVIGKKLNVHCSAGTHNHGSSKVKLTNVVDYNWELKFHVGQLLAVHSNGNVVAYAIKGKRGGMVRIANLETNTRELIKQECGLIQDLSFALIPQQIILGIVDELGSLYVYNIDDKAESISCNLLMYVVHPPSTVSNYRLVWCPYIPSYGENSDTLDDPAKLLLLLNGKKVEIWDVTLINSQCGNEPITPCKNSYEGFVEISGHDLDVVDASFSPDGTAIATAGMDGYVKFFQVYMVDNEEPKCLHSWRPHDGAALSSLLFLDNMNTYGPDSKFWKFAITGSNHNTELKLWSCETWICLHTVNFIPSPASSHPQLLIKVHLDTTGHYLLLSDINNRILYVLQLDKNDSERIATISTISEFLLPAPFLSFCIRSAEILKYRYNGSSDDLCICEADDEDENTVEAVVIKMHVIQPKRLQDCTITYPLPDLKMANQKRAYSLDSCAESLNNLKENKSDDEQEIETKKQESLKLSELHSTINYHIQQQSNSAPLNLMTPDAFTSPVHASPNNKTSNLHVVSPPSLIKIETKTEDIKVENLIDVDTIIQMDRGHKDNFASAGSSPSREVQEILSFKNSQDEYFENIKQIEKNIEKLESAELEAASNGFVKSADNLSYSETSNDIIWPNIPIIKSEEIEESLKLAVSTENSQLQQLNARLASMETLILNQNTQMQNLQREIKILSKDFKSDLKDELRGVCTKELELALSRNQIQQAKLFENYVNIQKSMEREHHENLMTTHLQMFNKQILDKVQVIVTHELKNFIVPTVLNIFDGLKHQIYLDYTQKIGSLDHLVKENVNKIVNSKATIDALSTAVSNILKPTIEKCHKDMIVGAIVPNVERSCRAMFQQVNEIFMKGTKEYTAFVEATMSKHKNVQDKGKDLVAQMQSLNDNVKNNMEKLNGIIAKEIERQLNATFTSLQERLTLTVANLVGEQVKQGFKNHAAIIEDSVIHAVRSRTVTPSPHVIDTQVQLAQIQLLLAKGQVDAAFQQALSAADLALVVHVCEKVNPLDVFKSGSCLLPQPVILSLIQQLSADLARNTELKLKYLEEAVLNLETTNSLTKEHMPIVLKELLQQLNNFTVNFPTHNCIRNMKMLQMAVQSLLIP